MLPETRKKTYNNILYTGRIVVFFVYKKSKKTNKEIKFSLKHNTILREWASDGRENKRLHIVYN